MSIPAKTLYPAVMLDTDTGRTLQTPLLGDANAKKEEKRMREFSLYCFFGGSIVGIFSQLATLCLHYIMVSDNARFQVHSLKQTAVIAGLWSLLLSLLMLCLFSIGRAMVMLSSDNKELAAKCLLAMDRLSFIGSLVGLGVSWCITELILGTVMGAAVNVLILVIALGWWFLVDYFVLDSLTPPELMEDDQGLLMVV
jgi:hypothetical protein